MPVNFASFLLIAALVAGIVPPGYSAYIGAYAVLVLSLVTFAIYGWRERATFLHPVSLAILAAVALVSATVPFVYHGPEDLLAPVFILPMLSTIAIAMLARPAGWVPTPTIFAAICLFAATIAALGGAFEQFVLMYGRPGLGNNPIHYGTLAVLAGSLALVGVAHGSSPWRYLFLLGPIFGLISAAISGSRGPLAGGLAMSGVGMVALLIWFWRERLFRAAILVALAAGTATLAYVVSVGGDRVLRIVDSALNIFRFTGSSDDVRAALYTSALDALRQSPVVGFGHGQIMFVAESLYPDLLASANFDNLHADWANFASMAGGMGLLAYLLLLAAPILLLASPTNRQDRATVLGALLLTTGQLSLGISNAMFGVLPQTVIYAVALGYFLLRARTLSDHLKQ